MALQRISVVRLGGEAGRAVTAQFVNWCDERDCQDPTEFSPHQWSSRVHTESNELAEAILANAHALPIIFFNQHVDHWSCGDVFERAFPEGVLSVASERFEMGCYRLPDNDQLRRHLENGLASKRLQRFATPEEKRLIGILLEAVEAWGELVPESALVYIREIAGGLVTDEELVTSLKVVPSWLTEVCPIPTAD